jgi:hypothetical protein
VYNESTLKKEFKIHNLSIENCLEPTQSQFRTMFEMNYAENLAIKLEIEDCLLAATDPKIGWNFFKQFYVHLNPVKVRLTEELYAEIYSFFFGIKPDTESREEELANILPDYYLLMVVDQFKVQAWYRTSSVLKRLEGVNVGLEKFEVRDLFVHKKGLFDVWVKFLIKQLASQLFNVIGQKLFG